MTQPTTEHLSADELDALIGGVALARALSHTATCPPCREMLVLDRQLVALLGAMPPIEPMAGFPDRVMARVVMKPMAVLAPAQRSPREVAARRRVLGFSVLGSSAIAAGFAWAVTDPTAAHGWSGAAMGGVTSSLWLSLQAVVANTAEQPWFGAVRSALATPMRALPFLVGGAGLYAITLAGLGRLVAEPATDANW